MSKALLETASFESNNTELTKQALNVSNYDDGHLDSAEVIPHFESNNTTVLKATSSPNIKVRRSARISANQAIKPTKLKSPVNRKKKVEHSLNEIIQSYSNRSQVVTKLDHKSNILEIINNGDLKKLKMLPTIGLKTAYQIMSYRAIVGTFETLEDLKKLEAMKGKLWNKFLEVCFIVSIALNIPNSFSFHITKGKLAEVIKAPLPV